MNGYLGLEIIQRGYKTPGDVLGNLIRVRIKVSGIVQGVGFRPTTYRYAHELDLSGFVMNTPEGVTIEVEGADTVVKEFILKIRTNPPKLSKITSFIIEDIAPIYEPGFVIITSGVTGSKEVEISPDLAVCDDCLKDIFDKTNRRYLYPFTNCTNCGPRFSIIKDRPYDRAKTSMDVFKMCPDCEAEYNDPNNRRFHAQPNACKKCGPKVVLITKSGPVSYGNDAVNNIIAELKKGSICAIKGIGGFNIACDPFNEEALLRLRKLKNRPTKSFAMMMKDVEVVKRYCQVSKEEEALLLSSVAPIVILRKKDLVLDMVSPDNNSYGVMLPYTPLHHIMFKEFDCLIMTSANRRDEPIAINDSEVIELMNSGFVDVVLSNDRDIVNRSDDSIFAIVDDQTTVLRRSRGIVPNVINVNVALSGSSLSLGADLKNTFALRKKNKVYLSQYIGDLEDQRNYDYQKQEIEILTNLLNINTASINTDAHPSYQNNDVSYNKVYHHHAHALSVMAEHGLLGKKVMAVICDGTGYGTDGNIWGFEFMNIDVDYRMFERMAHLRYFSLPGGDKAIIEVNRIAASLTYEQRLLKHEEMNKVIDSDINCPKTSSLGRLFDGVASICGIIDKVDYEAQAAILLQKYAENYKGDLCSSKYTVSYLDGILDYRPMINGLLEDLSRTVSIEEVSYKFHAWVVESITAVIKDKTSDQTLIFSGGCFQNAFLCHLLRKKLVGSNINNFYFNNTVPTNDGGISLGQAMF